MPLVMRGDPVSRSHAQVPSHSGLGGALNPILGRRSPCAVRAIEPGVRTLIEEGGHRRRRGLDWAVLQSEPLLVGPPGCEYTRVLKQRSAAPKNPWQRSACGIESSRGRPGHPESRVRLIERLQPYFQATVSAQRFRGRSAFICAAGAGSTHRPKGEARLTQRMRPAGMVDDGEST